MAVDPGVERPSVTLADVGGLAGVKRRLRTFYLGPLTNPELRQMYGRSRRGGLLLYGPPGCGKTFLGCAVAGELAAGFLRVGLDDVRDDWGDTSEEDLQATFDRARHNAPCVLFFDHIDAVSTNRGELSPAAGRNLLVQLLSELDRVQRSTAEVFVLGATERPWDLDSALRRPGRFERVLLLPPPDAQARAAIIGRYLRNRPTSGRVDPSQLAQHCEGYSINDLRALCEAAAQRALSDSIATGVARPISLPNFQAALAEIPSTTGGWLESARSQALRSNDGGMYDDLLAHLGRSRQP